MKTPLLQKGYVIIVGYRIGVVGNKESVMAFKLVGFDVTYAENEKVARQTIEAMANANYGIIYVSDSLLVNMADVVTHYEAKVRPAIVSIPTHERSNGYGKQKIQAYVEKAVGQNIL